MHVQYMLYFMCEATNINSSIVFTVDDGIEDMVSSVWCLFPLNFLLFSTLNCV